MEVAQVLQETWPGVRVLVLTADEGTARSDMLRRLALEFAALHVTDEVCSRETAPELTPREVEILRQIGRGATNAEIAGVLSISKRTVETHVRHIYAKLLLENRSQAVLYAVTHGLVRA